MCAFSQHIKLINHSNQILKIHIFSIFIRFWTRALRIGGKNVLTQGGEKWLNRLNHKSTVHVYIYDHPIIWNILNIDNKYKRVGRWWIYIKQKKIEYSFDQLFN